MQNRFVIAAFVVAAVAGSVQAANPPFSAEATALATYALLESGLSPQDNRIARALEWLKTHKTNKTYSLGLRCNVWLVANQKTAGKYYEQLAKDTAMLVKAGQAGHYHYSSAGPVGSWDNSNSQYGLLGVWAGERGGLEIPDKYWQAVLGHWLLRQLADGGWGYSITVSRSSPTMTAAGVASLFICFDNVFAKKFSSCNSQFSLPAIERGLAWFDRYYTKTRGNAGFYYLYGIERVGLAAGYKYFGTSDWYKLGGHALVTRQNADGSWGEGGYGPVVNTSFALLFLVRGRNPVLFNKVEYHGDWNNRPRDLAMLTRWIGYTFEREVNWLIVNLRVPSRELHDAPILYIAGSEVPRFTEEELEKLRTFVWQGGAIFSCRECKGAGFGNGIREVYKKLFPDYELKACPPDHEIYNIYYKLGGHPEMFVIDNGIRPLVVHCDEDLPLNWQLYQVATRRKSFEAAANVFMYVTNRGQLRPRGTTYWPEPLDGFTPQRTVRLARLRYDGNYDPEPLAYERFSRLLGAATGTELQVIGPIHITDLPSVTPQIATLTGTGAFTLPKDKQEILKQFVAGGGTLFIDAAGGSRQFDQSARKLIEAMYGDELRPVALSSDLLLNPLQDVPDVAIKQVHYTDIGRKMLGGSTNPMLQAVFLEDRAAVIYSPLDVTAGLVGYPSGQSAGYAPDSAYEILRNVVLYASRWPGALKARQ